MTLSLSHSLIRVENLSRDMVAKKRLFLRFGRGGISETVL